MSVLVLSGGRTGTNVVLEILSGSKELKATSNVHDELTVILGKKVGDDYLSKADTEFLKIDQVTKFLEKNPELKVIFTLRHPYDLAMSKIYRGQPNTEGRKNRLADDATPETCMSTMFHMADIYKMLKSKFLSQMFIIKMEDVIEDPEKASRELCNFVGITYNDSMPKFYLRMRNTHKKKRYSGIDKNQIGLWKNWEMAYDGFFKTYSPKIIEIFEKIDSLVALYDYK